MNNALVDDRGKTVSASAILAGNPITAGTSSATTFTAGGTSESIAGSALSGQQSVLGGILGTAPVGSVKGGDTGNTITGVVGMAASGSAGAGVPGTVTGARIVDVALAGGNNGVATVRGAPQTLATGGSAALGQISGLPASASDIFRITLGGLFSFAPPGGRYLIETDPAFANRNNFVSSQYFIDRLGYDATRVQQRLGDAWYEQQLVGRQLTALTGTTKLAGFVDADAQYRALLDAGVQYSKRFELALGVGLSPEQMASLTSDMVLLVDVTVNTPSGPQHALAPVVYLAAAHAGTLQSSGALIASGGSLDLRTSGSLTNSGVIRAVTGSTITAGTTLTNGGRIDGGRVVTLNAGGDLISSGGAFSGGDVTLASGGNMRLDAVAASTGRTITADGKAGTLNFGTLNTPTAITARGALKIIARGDLTSQGAQLAAGNTATVLVGGTATLGAVNDSRTSLSWQKIGKGLTSTNTTNETVRGTSVTGGNGVSVAAGVLDPAAKLVMNGATIASATGAVALSGSGGVAISAVAEQHDSATTTLTYKGGFLSSTTSRSSDVLKSSAAVRSTVSGTSVSVTSSAGDIAVTGSKLVADRDVLLAAKGDVTIAAAQNTSHEDTRSSVKKSGLSIGGGELFLGVAKTATTGVIDTVTNTGSVIASAQGAVMIDAGKALSVTGSAIAGAGDVKLLGNSVTITNATDTRNTATTSKSSSFGLSIKPYENVSGAVNSVAGLPGRIGNGASGGPGQAGVTTASEAVRSVRSVMTAATDAVGLSASLGFSSSRSSAETNATQVVQSTVAGDHVAITARGGDLTAAGASISGRNSVDLAAARDVVLQSAKESTSSTNSSRSSGASIGVSVGVGLTGVVTATGSIGVSASSAKGNSQAVTQVNTVVDGGDQLTITSGRDTTLAGATASGRQVSLDAGRNLTIASVQDTSSSANSSNGFSLSGSLGATSNGSQLPTTSRGGSGGISFGTGSSTAATVTTQSGLFARGGTLTAKVADTTDLDGGVLVAVDTRGTDSGKLRLDTGRLVATDIQDSAISHNATLGLSGTINDPRRGQEAGKGNLPTIDGSYRSGAFAQTTKATIGQGQVTIRDTGSGTDLAGVNRDPGQSQVVTRDRSSGFTLYADAAAAKELGALASGDIKSSVILQTAQALGSDPFAAVKAAAQEVASLSDGQRKSGAIEALVDRIDSMVPGYVARQKSDVIADSRAAMIRNGATPVQADAAIATLEAHGTFQAAADLNAAITRNGNQFQRAPTTVAKVRAAVKDFAARGDRSPEAQAAFAQQVKQIYADDIVVVGRRLATQNEGIAALAVKVVGATGETFNTAPSWLKATIGYGSMALGGVSGVVKTTLGELTGLNGVIDKGKEVLTVGADALLRADSFGKVYGQNQDKTSSNPTYNQTTGVDLIGSTVLAAIVGGIRQTAKGDVAALGKTDFPDKVITISRQKQERHLTGGRGKKPDVGGEMASLADAQAVLDAYHSGKAKIVGKTVQGDPIVQVEGVTGFNISPGSGYDKQPTNVFIIKGTKSVSVVPTSPAKAK